MLIEKEKPFAGKFRTYVSLLLVVVLTSALIACSSQTSDTELVQAANNYMAKKQVREATLELRNALKKNPDNAQARYLLGKINLEMGDIASAEKEFRRAVRFGWNKQQSQLELAKTLLIQRKFKKVIGSIKAGNDWSKTARADLLGLQAAASAGMGNLKQASLILAAARKYKSDALQVLITDAQLQLSDGAASKAVNIVEKALKKHPNNNELLLVGANAAFLEKDMTRASDFYYRIIASEPPKLITRISRQARLGVARLNIVKKNYSQAQKALNPLVKWNPGDLELNYVLAILDFEEKNYDKAEIDLRKILKLAPDNLPTLLLFGAVSYAKGDFEQAVYSLSRYVSAQPGNLYARKLLGRTYLALQQPEKARAALHTDANGASKDVELLALAGLSAIRSGQVETGIFKLKKAVGLSPDSNILRSELANAYIAKGETNQALNELEKVIASGKDVERAKIMMVFAYLQDRKFEKAIQLSQKMFDKQPGNATVTNLMGIVYYMSGDLKKARQYFEKTLQIDPGNIAAFINLARLDEKAGKIKQAGQLYRKIITISPDNVTALMALARLAEAQGNKQQQIKWLEKVRSADKQNIVSRVVLAEHFIQTKNFIKVKKLLNEMQAEHKGQATVLVIRAEFLIATKSYNQAVSDIRNLIETHPDTFVGYYLNGLNQLKMGQQQKAISSLSKAYKLNPKSIQSSILLAQLRLNSHEFKAALALGEHIKLLVPEKPLGFVITGDAYMGLHKYQQAMQAYDAAWRFEHTRGLVLRRLSASQKIYSGDRSYAVMVAWLDQHPDDALMRFKLAGIYQLTGKTEKAIKQYEDIVKDHPKNVAVLNNLAWILNQRKDPRALEYAKRAFNLNGSAAIKDTYGWILLKNHKNEAALKLLTDAVKALPDVPDVKYHYAMAVYESGDKQTGIALLRKLLESNVVFDGRADAMSLTGSR